MFDSHHKDHDGFLGGITLKDILWGLLVGLVMFALGLFLLFIVTFALYTIWYTWDYLQGRTRGTPEVRIKDGKLLIDHSKVNRADFIETADGVGSFIYALCFSFGLALAVAVIYSMVTP